jgi:hypothetical protein
MIPAKKPWRETQHTSETKEGTIDDGKRTPIQTIVKLLILMILCYVIIFL